MRMETELIGRRRGAVRRRIGTLCAVLLLLVLPAASVCAKTARVESADGRFRIRVPEDWSDLTGSLDPAGKADGSYQIEAGSDKNESYLVFREEDLDEELLPSFDDYFNTLTEGVTGSPLFSDVLVSSPADRTLDKSGMLCRSVTFSAAFDPGDGQPPVLIFGRLYAVQGGNGTCYQFFGWTKAANALDMGPVFDEIVDSFVVAA